jgi:hypothetical protein
MVYYSLSGYNSDMFLVGILSWWYGKGWIERAQIMKNRLKSSADFFSIDLLTATLFAPFRQISAVSGQGSISYQVRAFFDKLLSRFIGAFMRISMIIIGSIIMILQIIFGIIILLFWSIIPFFPAIGLIGTVIGLVPQWLR